LTQIKSYFKREYQIVTVGEFEQKSDREYCELVYCGNQPESPINGFGLRNQPETPLIESSVMNEPGTTLNGSQCKESTKKTAGWVTV